ncbi:MAG: helix-turn-helix transcriptional regulator [Ruminococcaceae bacterium]|nr:helix-turn-helix transcriptional regulator [Oscillospiraceae bacterium]
MELDYKIIGDRIRECRKNKNWTQAMLAEKSGIEPSNISHIERAATKLSLATLVSIANALEVTSDELIYGNLKVSSHISIKAIDSLLSDCTADELEALSLVIQTTKSILRAKR